MECEYIIIWWYKAFSYENLYVSMYVAERLDKQGKLFRTFVIENFVIETELWYLWNIWLYLWSIMKTKVRVVIDSIWLELNYGIITNLHHYHNWLFYQRF